MVAPLPTNGGRGTHNVPAMGHRGAPSSVDMIEKQ